MGSQIITCPIPSRRLWFGVFRIDFLQNICYIIVGRDSVRAWGAGACSKKGENYVRISPSHGGNPCGDSEPLGGSGAPSGDSSGGSASGRTTVSHFTRAVGGQPAVAGRGVLLRSLKETLRLGSSQFIAAAPFLFNFSPLIVQSSTLHKFFF